MTTKRAVRRTLSRQIFSNIGSPLHCCIHPCFWVSLKNLCNSKQASSQEVGVEIVCLRRDVNHWFSSFSYPFYNFNVNKAVLLVLYSMNNLISLVYRSTNLNYLIAQTLRYGKFFYLHWLHRSTFSFTFTECLYVYMSMLLVVTLVFI